ncbi:hypothetical protein RND71_001255 [Anisodus tanguticus]|uniref:Uncharacterized protein n=1 Tax=Anisodus tanguticus TaxID=243964 RepID=A0AAE1SXJ2_9SOLA|nr:hypothetical protein RND71_001255 [Anisodus tanguticus]
MCLEKEVLVLATAKLLTVRKHQIPSLSNIGWVPCVFLTAQIHVFGLDKRYWFIPAYSEEDLRRRPALHGLEYPSKPELESQEL